jgi:hypothetical protein
MEEIGKEEVYYILGIDGNPLIYAKIMKGIDDMHDRQGMSYVDILRELYLSLKDEFIDSLQISGFRS